MKKIILFCIITIILGLGLFLGSNFLLPDSSPILSWSIGLGAALIVIGLGYLINLFILTNRTIGSNNQVESLYPPTSAKEKAGYLVCKLMNILLCIFLLLVKELNAQAFVMILGIILLLLQFVLDLFLQFILFRKFSFRHTKTSARRHSNL